MKFSQNGYYIEKYIKCSNCGVLIYANPITSQYEQEAQSPYCTEWCVEWAKQKQQGIENPIAGGNFDH
jgi:hypothetical protein